MQLMVRNRSKGEKCVDCQSTITSKGGLGRCVNHYKVKRRKVIKQACVEYMGGKCAKCETAYPLSVYDFHHVEGKDASIAKLMANGSIEKLADEISKCIVLCANCHRIEHHE